MPVISRFVNVLMSTNCTGRYSRLTHFLRVFVKDHGITGIKIHRITRIHNRVLRIAFDEKVSSLIAKNSDLAMTDE